ncbi:MAG: TRAP transporter small permease [candidate division NC10 bacterium]|nr:TRAP transporter small permease [candidate division NC10 bacterium]MBI2164360.1 TRAP transporter small permease [candidate division NC10 bacterium]MBI2455211.1 TRAP transporter small permease [candidate division NC10 bacterium]MBI3084869.1 TRAP transporter small permease [candidate division NC10 bacterium]
MSIVIDRIVNWALAACLGVMTCIVFVSVVFRYVLNSPLAWTEELASLLFAWLTFVGATVGIRSRSHISIDTLVVFLPEGSRRVLSRMVDAGVLLLLAVFTWQGFRLTLTTWDLEFPAMEISRGYLYASLPVAACLMALALIRGWWQAVRGRGASGPGKERRA